MCDIPVSRVKITFNRNISVFWFAGLFNDCVSLFPAHSVSLSFSFGLHHYTYLYEYEHEHEHEMNMNMNTVQENFLIEKSQLEML